MRVALIQSRPRFGAPEENLESLRASMAAHPADFYVLPELCLSGYDFEDAAEARSLAFEAGAPLPSALAESANAAGAGIAFGFAELGAGGAVHNSALLALPGGRRRVYRKTHLFAREKLCFRPGDTGFFVEEWRGLRVGPAVCFDWIFPESFRTLALLGADLIAHCSNLVLPWCQKADFARAVENRVFIATANRVGTEERGGRSLRFTGGSVLVDPTGNYLLDLPTDEPAVGVVDIDPLRARSKAVGELNELFKDRRPEFYQLG